ncbi:MAG: LUD domain-containing protein [Chloroflexota bacterium]|nr:LUD domain-containing protein [Chloroflexota bacterium]MDQ5866930.1 LUD domain-containing protein [Chloroflexota bacterium]
MKRIPGTGIIRKVPAGKRSPSNVEESPHIPLPFERRYRRALADAQLQGNLLNFQRSWRSSRDAAWAAYPENPLTPKFDGSDGSDGVPNANPIVHLPDIPGMGEFEALRNRLAAIKDGVIERLPEYIDQFQRAAEANGVRVFRAKDADEANQYVLDLCARKGITHVVKSKTMVSEETNLNAALEEHGIEPVETDLGEWIVQLAHERPSHMVMPAIHKSRQQVGQLFTDTTGYEVSREDITEQVGVARKELRRDFLEAGLGINGANALIAESGTVMFIENEGNARLVTSLPRVHVVFAGIEKLVPDYAAAMLQLRLLARSATAQTITSYTSFVSGPPEPGKEMHIVLLDNGRMEMREHPLIKEALRCIRCAACANVCPPYAVVGGHVFGYIYSGAIGLVNTPYHHGLEAGAGPQSLCVSCNACATVCPVGIPLPQQILAVRSQVVEKKSYPLPVRFVLSLWSQPRLFDLAMRLSSRMALPFSEDGFLRVKRTGANIVPKVHALTAWRTPPAPATVPARDRLASRTPGKATIPSKAEGLRVAYFIQCITDRLFPGMAEAVVSVLEACGAEVTVPKGQHCCGLPNLDAGDLPRASRMAKQTIEVLESVRADYILTGGASCAIAMLHEYEGLFEHEPAWQIRALALKEKVIDFVTFMDRVAQLEPGALSRPGSSIGPITYHSFCQSTNVLGINEAPKRIIRDVLGLELRDLPEGTVCCGFGGSTSIGHPEVASQILKRKLDNLASTGAKVLVTDNPGCIMHLRGGIDAAKMDVKVMHLAELMAVQLK